MQNLKIKDVIAKGQQLVKENDEWIEQFLDYDSKINQLPYLDIALLIHDIDPENFRKNCMKLKEIKEHTAGESEKYEREREFEGKIRDDSEFNR